MRAAPIRFMQSRYHNQRYLALVDAATAHEQRPQLKGELSQNTGLVAFPVKNAGEFYKNIKVGPLFPRTSSSAASCSASQHGLMKRERMFAVQQAPQCAILHCSEIVDRPWTHQTRCIWKLSGYYRSFAS